MMEVNEGAGALVSVFIPMKEPDALCWLCTKAFTELN